MKYPKVSSIPLRNARIAHFGGYVRGNAAASGQASDMMNLGPGAYPALSTRKGWWKIKDCEKPHGIHGGDQLLEVYGTTLYADGIPVGEVTDTDKTFCTMGADVVIFPDKLIYRKASGTLDALEAHFASQGEVRFSLADLTGAQCGSYTAGDTAPVHPADGQLWVDTSGAGDVLRQFSASYGEWLYREASYILIEAPGIGDGFGMYDGVKLQGCTNSALSEDLILYGVWEDAVLVAGVLRENFTQTLPLTLTRSVPDLSFPVVFGNRLWGCDAHEHLIRASKLGDPGNFSCFMGLSTDSWAAQSGAPGDFTGSACVMGHPVFFTADSLTVLYGSQPSNFSLQEILAPGIAPGCGKAAVMVGDSLYYPSRESVYVFRGGMPRKVSADLGSLRIRQAVGGALEDRYCLHLTQEDGQGELLCLDTQRELWYRWENADVIGFARKEGRLYMGTADALFLVDEGEDENMPWYWESGDLAAEFPERFEILRVSLDMECRGAVTLAVSRDEEPFEVQWTAQTAGKRTTLVCPLVTEPEHSFRVRLEGTGPMKLYAMQLRFKAATEVEDG